MHFGHDATNSLLGQLWTIIYKLLHIEHSLSFYIQVHVLLWQSLKRTETRLIHNCCLVQLVSMYMIIIALIKGHYLCPP